MMFWPTPTVVQALQAVGGLDQHPYGRVGAVTLVQDPHLVVDQLELLDRRVRREQGVADGVVEGVDRAVALPHHPLALALGRQPYGALGIGLLAMRATG